jgi:hypothetical protein
MRLILKYLLYHIELFKFKKRDCSKRFIRRLWLCWYLKLKKFWLVSEFKLWQHKNKIAHLCLNLFDSVFSFIWRINEEFGFNLSKIFFISSNEFVFFKFLNKILLLSESKCEYWLNYSFIWKLEDSDLQYLISV